MIKTLLRRLSPFFILLLFIVGAGLLMKTKETPEQKPEEMPIPIVDVTQVEQQTVSLNLPSYGVVTPKYKTQLVTEVQGRMLTISPQFVAGGIVKKGDQLAQIEPSDYEADLMQAEATLAQATAALNEEIARGEVAKIEFKGYDKGLPPELGLRIPQLKKEQANVKYAQAALARAQRNLERTVIRAPFDGIIKARNVDLGQYVTLGTNLGELYDTRIAEIRLPISNDDLAYLESVDNPDTQVTLSASLAGKENTWIGNIIRSEGVIDADNRMVYLVAEIKDPYLREHKTQGSLPLKYGSFVNAVIKGRTVDGIVKLPRHVVRNEHVALINNNNIVEMRHVNVVRSDLENVFIKDSLKTGERVAITHFNNMANGQLVKVIGEETKPVQTPKEDAPESSLAATGVK
ncbi:MULTISPECIES: efflux RND transporter periplasmic adaptor subunit [Shewanella]|uniref:Efflux RND transporter periplasmic adaptor subunit n=1 Tax=Shewanella xiamenensis TaxID=332186 RepID=A0AAW6QU43_9GAMM|nr:MULTISPECIES: efflux RND transporter periplasmic adaptor subunit [Shewanella]KEK29490.1 RND family efflux transporter MFP subunit [Shewanella xiamenensis]MCH7422443.1 efflux RND transporter periplasmic adaptor subunit [Shewanella sp. MM_2022_3]MCT8867625.1 efflux RND transporter periplasmic adaptor subunit [Shewanella xiamenensis]MDG5898860.1 efflux RND transporter periplasmic adaptor subunit [Shewanella xiamenensis]MDL3985709.1 efflux RND transporter periplasmic adaptor subunit [Shewanella